MLRASVLTESIIHLQHEWYHLAGMLVQLVQVRPWVVIALGAIVALVCLAGFIALDDGHHSDLAAADCFRGCSRVGCRHDWGSSLSPAASRGRDGWPPAS